MKRLESYDTKRGLSSAGDNCTGCGWKWLRSRVPERRRGGRALASKKLGPQTPASPHPGNYSFPTTWGPTSGLVWMNIPCSLSMCWMLHMEMLHREIWQVASGTASFLPLNRQRSALNWPTLFLPLRKNYPPIFETESCYVVQTGLKTHDSLAYYITPNLPKT